MKLPFLRLSIVSCVYVTAVASARAEELHFESGAKQTALVELYTSEGCSSCPPAEAWLSKLKSDAGLWKDFVPLAFHVDYWDRLGWRDRFAAAAWTQRQYAYASLLRGDSVYTPEFVVNGNEWRDWFRNHLPEATTRAGILSATTTDGKRVSISYQRTDESKLEAHLALLGCEISSKIGGGENGGRQLIHDFVVLDNRAMSMTKGGEIAHADIAIEKFDEEVPQKAVAIWITRAKQLAPLQATGGWLGNVALKK
jgi:hypothetical protein